MVGIIIKFIFLIELKTAKTNKDIFLKAKPKKNSGKRNLILNFVFKFVSGNY